MKKRKIFISLLVCAVLIFSMTVPAFAVTPRGPLLRCPDCNAGTVYETTSRRYAHDELFPCRHGHEGYDLFSVYEIIYRGQCNNCSYGWEKETAEHVFVDCLAN